MRRAKLFLPILLILTMLLVSMSIAKDPASPAPRKITVGEFALKVLRLADDDPAVNASLTAEQAVARLKQAGLRLKGSPDDPLTEGDRSAFFLAVANGLIDRVSQPPGGFDDCAGLPTVPECHSCCLSLPGATNQTCGRACGQAHAGQNASPSEPTP